MCWQNFMTLSWTVAEIWFFFLVIFFLVTFFLVTSHYPNVKGHQSLTLRLGGSQTWAQTGYRVFGDSTWMIVHKNCTLTSTEIAVISLIMVRFWWSFFFVFLVRLRANRFWPEITSLVIIEYLPVPPTERESFIIFWSINVLHDKGVWNQWSLPWLSHPSPVRGPDFYDPFPDYRSVSKF